LFHLAISACSEPVARKLMPENRKPNLLQNSYSDFIAKQTNVTRIELPGIPRMGKCYRCITSTVQNRRWSPNSRKLCR